MLRRSFLNLVGGALASVAVPVSAGPLQGPDLEYRIALVRVERCVSTSAFYTEYFHLKGRVTNRGRAERSIYVTGFRSHDILSWPVGPNSVAYESNVDRFVDPSYRGARYDIPGGETAEFDVVVDGVVALAMPSKGLLTPGRYGLRVNEGLFVPGAKGHQDLVDLRLESEFIQIVIPETAQLKAC